MIENVQLEAVNAFFLALDICALIIFSHYIAKNWNEGYRFLRPSIALWGLFFGEFVLRANFWSARHIINAGNLAYYPNTTVTVVGSFIAGWSILCCIAVFSPERWGKKPWVISAIVTLVFVTLALTRII